MRGVLPLCLALLLALGAGAGAQTAPPSVVVHPGDQLQIAVLGEDELAQTVVVASDGTIGLPLVGEIRVGGATPSGAAGAIAIRTSPSTSSVPATSPSWCWATS